MTESRRWLILAGISVSAVLMYFLAPVLAPFLMAALFAYLGDPLVDRLETFRVPRTLAVVIVFIIIFTVVLVVPIIIVPLLEQQISAFIVKLPGHLAWIQAEIVPRIANFFGVDAHQFDIARFQSIALENWQKAGGIAATVLSYVKQSGLAMIAIMVNIFLVPVVTFYLLRDWDILIGRIRELIPRKHETNVVRLARESDEVLGAFLRGQITVMFCLGTVYSLGLWMVGLDVALLIGMIAGLVSFVPYLGFIVGIILAGFAAFMQFHEFLPLLWVALVFGVGQMLEGMLLTPLLVGDKIGMHPVAVIFAIMAGGQLFGFVGILLALPVAAIVMVMLRFAHENYISSKLYSS
jgi:predicted PurR-regulated permease PerM